MLTNRSTKGGQKQMLKAAALGELVLPTSSWEGLPDEPASEHTGTRPHTSVEFYVLGPLFSLLGWSIPGLRVRKLTIFK